MAATNGKKKAGPKQAVGPAETEADLEEPSRFAGATSPRSAQGRPLDSSIRGARKDYHPFCWPCGHDFRPKKRYYADSR